MEQNNQGSKRSQKIGGGILAALLVGILIDTNIKVRQSKKVALDNSKKLASIEINQKRTSFDIGDTLREVKEQSRIVYNNSECVKKTSKDFKEMNKSYEEELDLLFKNLNIVLRPYKLAEEKKQEVETSFTITNN